MNKLKIQKKYRVKTLGSIPKPDVIYGINEKLEVKPIKYQKFILPIPKKE